VTISREEAEKILVLGISDSFWFLERPALAFAAFFASRSALATFLTFAIKVIKINFSRTVDIKN